MSRGLARYLIRSLIVATGLQASGTVVSKLVRQRCPEQIGPGQSVCIPLAILLFLSGCYHWVPIESSYTNERPRKFDELRIGGEGGELVYDASLDWNKSSGLFFSPCAGT